MIHNIFDNVKLRDGQRMPGYGFGVYKAAGDGLYSALLDAFKCGYRYIDTASFYRNEEVVGRAIKASGLGREELFILSKIWPSEFADPAAALERSLSLLGLDYLDGYLMHWPGLDRERRLKTYEYLLHAKADGKIHVLGVSNYLAVHLQELHDRFQLWPDINQIEIHPLFQQKNLCAFCSARDIKVVAWAPLGRGGAMSIPQIEELAAKLHKTPAQVILRWHVQENRIPIPKSVHPDRIRENADVFDFELDDGQTRLIDALDLPDNAGRTGKDPLLWPTD